MALDFEVDLKVYDRVVTSTYKINEVARRSGFTPATLRYYEDIGLVPAVARTDSGYRQYGDEVIDRLAFIARAKQLGCSLEETADLLVAWDGGECGPIQDRLRVLVASKTQAAENQIAELTLLRLQLLKAGAALAGHRPDGPCDETCGCSAVATTPAPATAVRFTVKPVATPPGHIAAPIACTATAESATRALQEWAALFAAHRDSMVRSAIPGGVRVQFSPAVDIGELARLTVAEQDCCGFLSFAITVDRRGVGLEIVAPDDALPIVHTVFGAAS